MAGDLALAAFEAASAPALVVQGGRLQLANAAAERWLAEGEALVPGTPVADVLRAALRSLVSGVVEGERDVAGAHVELVDREGRRRTFTPRASSVPLSGEGRGFAVVLVLTDVTDQIGMERMKDELLSRVSHELRTPLASLRGFAELMLSRDFSRDDQRRFLGIILDESVRLTSLITVFLDLQKMRRGEMVYDLVLVDDLATHLARTAEVFRGNLSAAHELVVAIEDPLPVVRADVPRIREVLANLISNAIKFSPDGGRVEVGAGRRDQVLEVWVRDQGIGIGTADQRRLFQQFFRAESARTREISGSGLGLTLAREIVEAHWGAVHLESELGVGTRVSFTLPVAHDDAAVLAPPAGGSG